MTMTCSVCNSYHRHSVDSALMQGHSYAKIARDYDLSADAVRNHHLNHLSRQLVQAWERRQDAESRDLLAEIDELVIRTKKILDVAERKGKLKTALAGIRELRGSYELMSRIAFSLHQAKQADIEAARIESGEHEAQQEQEFIEKLKILSQPELKLYAALLDKIHSQDADQRPIGKALNRPMLYLSWLESPDEYAAAFNPLGIEHIDLLEPLKVEPIEPLEPLSMSDPLDDAPMQRTRKASEPLRRGPGRPKGTTGSKRVRADRAKMRRKVQA